MNLKEWNQAMSQGYWNRWNDQVQAKIDHDIEQHRKADACFNIKAPAGTDVQVQQLSHDFIFGAHIFNFDQLGTDQRNDAYKNLYGTLFNSATIAFYWQTLEPTEGKNRFVPEYRDTPDFWNQCENPKYQPHWRRPAVDPVVEFCLKKKIRLHGHTLVWGNNAWQIPEWLFQKVPLEYLKNVDLNRNPKNGCFVGDALKGVFKDATPEEIARKHPDFAAFLNTVWAKRICEIATRYGDKIDSWDVVNESATDFQLGRQIPDQPICNSVYGPMPGDYTFRGFKFAEAMLPQKALLNINDYNLSEAYLQQVQQLLARGCKIDCMGAQMHLFNPQQCIDIADGVSDKQSPEEVYQTFTRLQKANLPIHLSEITITAPNNDERGQAIQAVITRNLYRLWFSLKPMMGITWWNVVDDCGAPGEPSVSGLFSRNMEPKPAYHVLEDLINHQWKTTTTAKVAQDGTLEFRGFRGTYRLTWQDASNREVSQLVNLH